MEELPSPDDVHSAAPLAVQGSQWASREGGEAAPLGDERIKALARAANLEGYPEELRNFARLVAEECAKLVDAESVDMAYGLASAAAIRRLFSAK